MLDAHLGTGRAMAGAPVRGAQLGASRRRRASCARRAASARAPRCTSCSWSAATASGAGASARAGRGGPGQPPARDRGPRERGDGAGCTNAVTEVARRRRRDCATRCWCSARPGASLPRREAARCARSATAGFTAHTLSSAGALVRNDAARRARGRGRRVRRSTGCSSAGGRQLVDNHTLVDHAVPALHEPRALQGRARRRGARRVPRPRDRAAGRAEDRRAQQSNPNLLLGRRRRGRHASRSSRSTPTT